MVIKLKKNFSKIIKERMKVKKDQFMDLWHCGSFFREGKFCDDGNSRGGEWLL